MNFTNSPFVLFRGFTTSNTKKLVLQPPAERTPDDRKWAQPPVQYSIGGGPTVTGGLLIDTGILSMFMCTNEGYSGDFTTNANGIVTKDPDTVVKVNVPWLTGEEYQFTMDKVSSSVNPEVEEIPTSVKLTNNVKHGSYDTWLNVGRRFLRSREYFYDHDNGYMGVRDVA